MLSCSTDRFFFQQVTKEMKRAREEPSLSPPTDNHGSKPPVVPAAPTYQYRAYQPKKKLQKYNKNANTPHPNLKEYRLVLNLAGPDGTVKKCQGPRVTNAVGEKLYFAPKNRAILGVWVHESERLPKNYRAQVTGYTFRKGHDNTKPYSVTYHEILEQVELMRNPPARKPPRKKKPRKVPKKHQCVPVPVSVSVSVPVPVPVKAVVPVVPVAEDPFAALTMLAKVAAQ